MDNSDFKLINNIYDIDYKIYAIYNKLSSMDESDIKLYNKYKYMLKILIASENNLYNGLKNNSYEYLSGLLEYIDSLSVCDVNINPVYAICDYDDAKCLIYYRIYQKIKMLLMNDNHFIADNLDNDLKIFESNKDDSLNYLKVINYKMNYEYNKMSMLFLNECDDYNVVIRKYLYTFLSPLIENEMIDNDFMVTNCSFWDNIRTISKYNVFENYLFSKYGLENSKYDLKNLLDYAYFNDFNILDSELSEDMSDFNSIVCSFKAGLLFLSNEDLVEVKNWIDFYRDDILGKDNINDINDLVDLPDMDDDVIDRTIRFEDITEYINNIIDNIDIYRKIANKDSNGKIFRLE